MSGTVLTPIGRHLILRHEIERASAVLMGAPSASWSGQQHRASKTGLHQEETPWCPPGIAVSGRDPRARLHSASLGDGARRRGGVAQVVAPLDRGGGERAR